MIPVFTVVSGLVCSHVLLKTEWLAHKRFSSASVDDVQYRLGCVAKAEVYIVQE